MPDYSNLTRINDRTYTGVDKFGREWLISRKARRRWIAIKKGSDQQQEFSNLEEVSSWLAMRRI